MYLIKLFRKGNSLSITGQEMYSYIALRSSDLASFRESWRGKNFIYLGFPIFPKLSRQKKSEKYYGHSIIN